jgi:hypothetical protein
MTLPAPPPEPSAELDDALFQAQVERELEPLYMQETSPVAAMRMRSRSSSSLAWLGPMALVGIAFIFVFLLLPYFNQLLAQTWGIVVLVVVLPLFGISNQLGRRRKAQQAALQEQQQHIVDELRLLEPEAQEWVLMADRLAQQRDLSVDEQARLLESWEQSGRHEASKLLAQPEVRELLCPALHEAPKDVFGLSKVTTPVLLEHAAAGRLTIPRVPVLFAAVALGIHREGVDAFCSGNAESTPADEATR